MTTLEIRDLHVEVEHKEIVKGVDLKVSSGEIHALMGPNASGKSTLAYALTGHPKYKVTKGEVLLDGDDILALTADQRARRGLFLAFQYPVAIPGVTVASFLKTSYDATKEKQRPGGRMSEFMSVLEFQKMLKEQLMLLEMEESFANRYLNEGFSGGEKKRCEVLQMAILRPRVAVLDETDSGLDIDALKIVANGVNRLSGPDLGVLLITHYQRLLKYIRPDFVHILIDGRIVMSDGPELAGRLEEKGYDWVKETRQ